MAAAHDSDAAPPAALSPALALLTLVAFGSNLRLYQLVCDDAFISFRYARHLVEGLGLVWNPGEAVEGYSNFLWVLISAAGLAVGVLPETLMPILGALSGAAILVLLAAFGARKRGWQDPSIWYLPGLLALSRSFAAWSISGLETQFFSLLLLLAYLSLLRERERQEAVPWLSSLFFALATLTRPDGGLFTLSAGICFLASVLRARDPRALRALVIWTLPYLLIVGSHFLWRHSYYGYWLPNTFYAKVNEFSWGPGITYLKLFARGYYLAYFLPLALAAPLLRRDFTSSLFAVVVGIHIAYIIYVGGDFLEYRFLVPILPYLYWLILEGARALIQISGLHARSARSAGIAYAAFFLLLATTTHLGSVSKQAEHVGGGLEGIGRTRRYGEMRAAQGKLLRNLEDRGVLPPGLRIQTGGAGALPYYSGLYTLDKRGLNDLRIAREPVRFHRRPGHQHHATVAYTREKKIDIILIAHQLLFRSDEQPKKLAQSIEKTRDWVDKVNRELSEDDSVHLRCLEVEENLDMVFATTLDPQSFESRVGRFPDCGALEPR